MKRKKKAYLFKQERTRIFDDKRMDVYQEKQKYKEPTRCPKCSALFLEGRWTWEDTSKETHFALCPACRRIEDHYPAGFIRIGGSFFEDHRKEIMHLIKNLEHTEGEEHPLERIMEVQREDGQTVITTTGIHLPRRIGDALKHAYQGKLDVSYDAENFIRVNWQR